MNQRGAALLTVLSVLVIVGIIVTLLMDKIRPDARLGAREAERAQALYLAESGIAYQLYLERFSDSADPTFNPPKPSDSLLGLPVPKAPADTFRFYLDSALQKPDVQVDRTRAFLDITANAAYRNTKATVFARFGKALDDSVFGPALTLENSDPLEQIAPDHVFGKMRIKSPQAGQPTLNWSTGFSLTAYLALFTDKKYYALESLLEKKLGEDSAQSGNGNFDPDHPPDFAKSKDMVFNLGRVELVNDKDETWVLRGPGRIFSEGEIRVKGLIRLDNIQLLSGKEITFEDSVTGEDNSAFARNGIYFHNRCRLGIEAVAGKDILLQDHCQTTLGSVLLSVGNVRFARGMDSVNAVRVVNQAVARGFLIAGGPNGRVVLGTQENRVEGVVMACSAWIGGEVDGPVLAKKLLCEGTNLRNCLGPGKIDRFKLPTGFVQPLQLGPQDRRLYTFKLMQWKRS